MNWNMFIPIALGCVMANVAVRWIYFKILKVAFDKKLVDNPDARKLQKRPVPVVGGLALLSFSARACVSTHSEECGK